MRDVSQRALGAMLGMTKKNGSVRINRYEQQTSRPDLDTASALAEVLDVPLSYLVCKDDNLANLILAYSSLTTGQQAEVTELALKLVAAPPRSR